MRQSVIGIDLNGIQDQWCAVDTLEDIRFDNLGSGAIPSVVIFPSSRGEKPLAGTDASLSIDGRGWQWPEEAAAPNNEQFCQRVPVIELIKRINQRDICSSSGNRVLISEMLGAHINSLVGDTTDSAIVAVPDHIDETFQEDLRDCSYHTKLKEMTLLWRPIAMILAWAQPLDANVIKGLDNSTVLTLYLDALGLQASIVKLEVENSIYGPLLTPVRYRQGVSSSHHDYNMHNVAVELAQFESNRRKSKGLYWQLLWGTSYVWAGLNSVKTTANIFQYDDGSWIEITPKNLAIPPEARRKLVNSCSKSIDKFSKKELSSVEHVLIDGLFLNARFDQNDNVATDLTSLILSKITRLDRKQIHVISQPTTNTGNNSACAKGAAIFGWRLANELPTYYDFLPQLEINATLNNRPEFIPLVLGQPKIKGGKPFGPYEVPHSFDIPAQKTHLDFYIYKEGEPSVRFTRTKLKEPPENKVGVSLVVNQKPGQGHAIVRIQPDHDDVFGQRELTLDWKSLTDTDQDKVSILRKLTEEAGISFPDHAPVLAHRKMWENSHLANRIQRFVEASPSDTSSFYSYQETLDDLYNALKLKRTGDSLGVTKSLGEVYAHVGSDGQPPNVDNIESDRLFFYKDVIDFDKLIQSVIDKLSQDFELHRKYYHHFKQFKNQAQSLLKISAWLYKAAPKNVITFLNGAIATEARPGFKVEWAGRCVHSASDISDFFKSFEKISEKQVTTYYWIKGTAQVLQFRDYAPKMLTDKQAVKFLEAGLETIKSEMKAGHFKHKFLWGIQLVMLLFRYRLRKPDFLREGKPEYAYLREDIKVLFQEVKNTLHRKHFRLLKFVDETLNMLDYKGTNQLIARELASEIAGSEEE